MNKMFSLALAVGATGLLAATTHAAVLPVGGGVLMAANTQAALGGTQIDTLTSPVTAGAILATLKSDVYTNDPTNPFGLAALTFVYTLTNSGTGDALERANFTNYAGFQTDVEYLTGTVAPSAATRSTLAQDGGTLVGFNFQDAFGSPSLPRNGVAVLIVHTDALGDARDVSNVIDGSVATVPALAPASGSGRTPEPASLGLLGMGGLMLLRRRK